MRFIFSKQPVGHDACDLLVRGVLENLNDVEAALKAHDKGLDGHLKDYVKDENFGGKSGNTSRFKAPKRPFSLATRSGLWTHF